MHQLTTVFRRVFCGVALSAAVSFASVAAPTSLLALPVAQAHDVVLDSTPKDGATVDSFPRTITLEFSAIPKDNFNTVAVSDATDGTVLFSAEPTQDKQYMSVTVPDDIQPGPGDYIIGYQITSSDGHATRGKTSFTVADAVGTSTETTQTTAGNQSTNDAASSTASNSEKQQDSALSLGAIVGIMALVALIGGVVVTIKKRK